MVFEGRILQVIEKALEFVRSQIKERTYLGADTRFVNEPEYPEFAWKELIVNAVEHRDYSIKGTDIQIKMFDDRLTIESPGTLPGIVRLNNAVCVLVMWDRERNGYHAVFRVVWIAEYCMYHHFFTSCISVLRHLPLPRQQMKPCAG